MNARPRLTPADLERALAGIGSISGPALMVHSSLSACGRIEGGAPAVVGALRAWAGAAALAMPTHTYCYPREGRTAPAFDAVSTPSVVGAVTECFRRQADAVRSVHPSHSLACAGALAQGICRDHEWAPTPCGPGTPYERLVGMNCAVLMFGVSLDAYTFFHTAEDAARVPYLYSRDMTRLTHVDAAGIRWSMLSSRHDMDVARRFAAMDAWLGERRLLQRFPLGAGELLFIPDAGRAHAALVEAMRVDPKLLLAGHAP